MKHLLTAVGLAACAIAPAACGPTVQPAGPGASPSGGTTSPPPPLVPAAAAGGTREVVLGEMCPDRGAGRPAVVVLAARRSLAWAAQPDELDGLLARGMIGSFAVLGFGGKRAGVFTVAGPVDLGTAWPVAIGGYAGAPPCGEPATAAECATTLGGCGVALAAVAAADPEEVPAVETGGACLEGDRLVVDVDGNGQPERFPAAAFFEGRAPAELVTGTTGPAASCTPTFARKEIHVWRDPKTPRALDVVAVLDADGDGRRELVLQLRSAEKRSWVVFAARTAPDAYELVAEAEPWGR